MKHDRTFKKQQVVLCILLGSLFFCNPAHAHSDFWKTEEFGNVTVRIKTGYHYEQINNTFIIGRSVERLAAILKYRKEIYLDFQHFYVGDCEPDYFISFEPKPKEYEILAKPKPDPKAKNGRILIRQIARSFDVETTLRLVDYAITNLQEVKNQQHAIEYHQNYSVWNIVSVDTIVIDNFLNGVRSKSVDKAMRTRVDRDENKIKSGISYYWRSGKYHLYSRKYSGDEKVIMTLDTIYDFQMINRNAAIVFNTDSSFYFLNIYEEPSILGPKIIQGIEGYFQPYRISHIGGNRVSIYVKNRGRPGKTLIYFAERDLLIQDLDKLVED